MTSMEHALRTAAEACMEDRPADPNAVELAQLVIDALDSGRLAPAPPPSPGDGCQCSGHSQDAGGGYVEYLMEYEPSCPVHSEHVWNPRTGMWEHAAPVDGVTPAEGDGGGGQ